MIFDLEVVKHFVPFALATGKQPQWNVQRLLETALIAAITAFTTMYGVQKQQEVEMANLRASMSDMRSEVRSTIRDIKTEIVDRVDRVENKVDRHVMRDKG